MFFHSATTTLQNYPCSFPSQISFFLRFLDLILPSPFSLRIGSISVAFFLRFLRRSSPIFNHLLPSPILQKLVQRRFFHVESSIAVSGMDQLPNSQTERKTRVLWRDVNIDKTFLEACIQEVNQSGREGVALKAVSWERVGVILKQNHNWVVDRKQMRNRYDYLKTKYTAWLRLKNKTGNIYDPSTNMFNLSNEEWANEIKANKHVESLRTVPLHFSELCVQLFEGCAARGPDGWGSSASKSYPRNSNDISHPVDTSSSNANLDPEVGQEKQRKRAKNPKPSSGNQLEEALLNTLSCVQRVFEPSTAPSSTAVPSIKDCREKLNRLGWDESGFLYEWATIIFVENASYREGWMDLKDFECEAYVRRLGRRLGLNEEC